jgi:uncharacterized protein with von Willebrand factor type A (vWA) domain
MHFYNVNILLPINALFLTYEILNIKIYIKHFLKSLLHVSVRADHRQGVYIEPGKIYFFVDTISKITSL